MAYSKELLEDIAEAKRVISTSSTALIDDLIAGIKLLENDTSNKPNEIEIPRQIVACLSEAEKSWIKKTFKYIKIKEETNEI